MAQFFKGGDYLLGQVSRLQQNCFNGSVSSIDSNIINNSVITSAANYSNNINFPNGGLLPTGPQGIRRKRRVLFTQHQVNRLEMIFSQNNYLTAQQRENISAEIGLKPTQVKIWFQNHRYKIKRQKRELQMMQRSDGENSQRGGEGENETSPLNNSNIQHHNNNNYRNNMSENGSNVSQLNERSRLEIKIEEQQQLLIDQKPSLPPHTSSFPSLPNNNYYQLLLNGNNVYPQFERTTTTTLSNNNHHNPIPPPFGSTAATFYPNPCYPPSFSANIFFSSPYPGYQPTVFLICYPSNSQIFAFLIIINFSKNI
ncbi:Homeobox domain-containing protein [Meloidogyne graminicola]|uniref:Homeobox domain-containing protein n=1 Tax=Meloidogyne graminicola TaxID=189291 RepID=A0A8S9ZSY0_9BILA|nr:Homeobox domain-containing protein [Meloidogyne graminicola]